MRHFQIIFLTAWFLLISHEVSAAKKYSYTITYYKASHNGEDIPKAEGKELKGTFKKNTKRLAVAELNDGSLLYVELWLTKEGSGSSKSRRIQQKFYLKTNGEYRLMCVTKKFVFKEKHLEDAVFEYKDPSSGETFSIKYKLNITQ